jgi:hypothetical protein
MTEPRDWLRRAGRGTLPDGGIVTWSAADGTRGRRWRWTVTDGRVLRHAGLIELDSARRFSRLELSSRAGLLTFHPERDSRSIHGNIVTPDGVRPLAFPWHEWAAIELATDAFATAILATGEGSGSLVIPASLVVVEGGGSGRLPLDERGVPVLANGSEWALED